MGPGKITMTCKAGSSPAEQPLQISYLLQQFPVPTETFAVSDIASLVAEGHRVTVYTMKVSPRREPILRERSGVPADVTILRPTLAGVLSWPKILWNWRREISWLFRRIVRNWRSAPLACGQALLCLPRLAEIADHIADHEMDVAHAFWSRHVGLVLPLLRERGIPTARTAFVGAYDLVADDFLLDLTTQAADVLFSHAEVNRPYLERKAQPGASIEIIHRGIPLIEPVPAHSRNSFRLITASALVRSKNLEAVIRCFASAHARDGRLTLEIYGDGPDRQRLEKLTRDLGCSAAVIFAGHVPRRQLFDQMQGATAFILLSKKPSERLPNVLKEALWAGCAVISSNSEGIEELIPNTSIGHVVDPDDIHAVSAALSAILSETPAESDARRANAREFIAANFSSEASMRRYVEAWRSKIRRDQLQVGRNGMRALRSVGLG